MTCGQMRPELPFYVRGELDGALSRSIERHLQSCPACAKESADIERVMGVMATTAVTAPPPELRSHVLVSVEVAGLDSLLSHAVKPPRAGLKEDVFAALEPAENSAVVSLSTRRWHKRSLQVMAAAALVAGIVVAASVLGDRGRDVSPVADGGIPAGHETQILALDGMGPEEAGVRHYRHDNFRVTLAVEGYGATPPGTHYAVWVRGPRGDVGVGTFRLKRPDDFTIDFEVGVNPSEYPDFVVTLEPNDGDPRLNGEVVTHGSFDPETVHHGRYDD